MTKLKIVTAVLMVVVAGDSSGSEALSAWDGGLRIEPGRGP